MYSIQVIAELLGEADGPPKVKKLLSCGKGRWFVHLLSWKVEMCRGKINKTHYKCIPQMNRIIVAE
jgi:hypothetical protein